MDEHFFDDLARGLDDGTITRRRALKLVGGAALGAALMPILPKQAEALGRRFRRRCRRKRGVPLEKGNCHCATTCKTPPGIHCHSNDNCFCFETLSGEGFCGVVSYTPAPVVCSSSADCPTGAVCVMERRCINTSCTSSADCPTGTCIKGTCQETFCASACPT